MRHFKNLKKFQKIFKHKICTIPLETFLFKFLFNNLTCFTIFKKYKNQDFTKKEKEIQLYKNNLIIKTPI